MLQVTFRNLLPSEELVGAANGVYLDLRERTLDSTGIRGCYVTISADCSPEERPRWVRVRVVLVRSEGTRLQVLAEGADASLAVRSGMQAAALARLERKAAPRFSGELALAAP